MKTKKYKVDVYLTLYPPDLDRHDSCYNRVALIKKILLDFVPYPGLCLRFEGTYQEQEEAIWSPLMKAASGPKGAVGRAFNIEIWPLNDVIYNVSKRRFSVSSYPEMHTREQLSAIEELMLRYYGFTELYPGLRRKHKAQQSL